MSLIDTQKSKVGSLAKKQNKQNKQKTNKNKTKQKQKQKTNKQTN